jgi:methyl-accepting chemotaxis protein
MMAIKALDNASIGIKAMIAPLVGCIFWLVLGIIFLMSCYSINDSLRQNLSATELVNQTSAIKDNFVDAHTMLYKAYLAQQTGASEKVTKEKIITAKKYLKSLSDSLLSFDAAKYGVDAALVKDLLAAEKGYEDSATQTFDLLETDASMATMFLNDCQGKYDPISESLYKMAAAAKTKEIELNQQLSNTISRTKSTILGIVLVSIILGFGIGGAVGRVIARPVKAVTAVMRKLTEGDMEVAIADDGRLDEVGEMTRAVLVFKESMIKNKALEVEQAKENKNRERRAEAVEKLIGEFQKNSSAVIQAVASAAAQLLTNSKAMSSNAEQTSGQSLAVAAASEEASTNVQTVASAADELHASITEIGRQVSESAHLAANAAKETEKTNITVEGLAAAAQKIGAVIELINNIAAQTNLLALNATIEAARAGDAGKGFAVVAQEVKTLADQTAKATEEISAQVTEMQNVTANTVTAIKSIGATITQLNQISTTIAASVEEQTTATNEIARSVEQAAQGTRTVSMNIGGVTDKAQQTGQMSGQVLQAGNELAHQGDVIRKEIETFINKVRNA